MPLNKNPITSQTSIEVLVSLAIDEVQNLHPGEKFMVRDLFRSYEWNRLSNYVRANLGAGFYHQYANVEGKSEVNILNKTARNQQLHSKKVKAND